MALRERLEELMRRSRSDKRVSDEIRPFYEEIKRIQDLCGEEAKTPSSINITLPGSNYIGPGNPLIAGEPLNNADKIAFLHDWAYEFSKSEKDVRDADLLAIKLFEKEYRQSGNWQALIGSLGLRAKRFVEKKVGRVLYPLVSSSSGSEELLESERTHSVGEANEAAAAPAANVLTHRS